MRNPEFEADALEELAEHVTAMEEMAAARMPGVGELLQAAAEAPTGEGAGEGSPQPVPPGEPKPPGQGPSTSSPQEPPQRVGEDRGKGGKPATDEAKEPSALPATPQVVEVEGRTLKLTGTAEERYREWRKLLAGIYQEENARPADPAVQP